METNKVLGTELDRRTVLKAGAIAGAAAFLAACGTSGSSSAPSESTDGTDSPSSEINFANWTYYIDVSESDPNVHPTLEKFKAQYGTTVDYQEVIEDNDSFYGQIKDALAAGKDSGWDIVTLTDWMAARIIRLGWAEDFDLANMPHFAANLKDEYKSVAWDSGAKKHAPWQSGMTGLGFDPAVTGELTSLACALGSLTEDTVICYGDLLFRRFNGQGG